MKKLLSLVLVALMVLPFGALATVGVSAAEEVIYVKDGGAGDGSSEANAFGSITAAVDAAAAKTTDVSVVIVGEVNFKFDAAYNEPAHTNKITIKGKDNNAKLIVETYGKVWLIGGEVEICNINIHITKNSAFVFTTQFYPMIFGEGINVTSAITDGEPKFFSVRTVGKTDTRNFNETKGVYEGDSSIVIKSGRFEDVAAFAQNGAKGNLEGTCRVYVGGDAVINNLVVCRSALYTCTNAEITLDGGSVRRHFGVSDKSKSGLGTSASGVTDTFKVIITKNYNPNAGWDHASPASTLFNGLSGCSADAVNDNATSLLDVANYILEIEDSVYDTVIASEKVRTATFDKVEKKVTTNNPPADTTTTPTTPPAQNNPNTGDSFVIIAVAAIIAAAALVVVSKKKVTR